MTSDLKPQIRFYGIGFRALTAVVALMFMFSVTATTFAYANELKPVTVKDGEQIYEFTTPYTNPIQIVNQAGLTLSANDELNLDGFDSQNGGEIEINRAKTVKVIDNDDIVYCVGYDTVGNTLVERGFGSADSYESSVPLDKEIYNGMQVVLNRAFTVTLDVDGKEQKVYTMDSTVEDVLEEAGVELNENDSVSKPLSNELSSSSTITVDRVEYAERIKTEDIPFETEKKTNNDLFEGETKVIREGSLGKKDITYKDKIVNGEVVSSEKISEEIISEPSNKIVEIGAKKKPTLISFQNGVEPISDLEVPSYVKLDSNGLPKKYVDYIEGAATAYCDQGYTASGRLTQQGMVAVDPKEIPYGSELYIVSLDGKYVYGYAIAADTGGFCKTTNNVCDLFMDSYDMCVEWGNRDVAIYVISYAE